MKDDDDTRAAVLEHNRRIDEDNKRILGVKLGVYVEAKCAACCAVIFSELYLPSVRDNWPAVAAFYQKQIEAHLALCPTTRPDA